jgi:hypothetical protein
MSEQLQNANTFNHNVKLNIHQRLALAMDKTAYIQKSKSKAGLPFSITSHDSVTDKVRTPLLEVGVHYYPCNLIYKQEGNRTQVELSVRFVNIDNPTDYFVVPSLGYGVDAQDKGPGKAISYAVKYALLKALGLVTGDDPELENVNFEPQPKTSSSVKQPTPKPEPKPEPTPEPDVYQKSEQQIWVEDAIEGFKKHKHTGDHAKWASFNKPTISDIKKVDQGLYQAVLDAWQKRKMELEGKIE